MTNNIEGITDRAKRQREVERGERDDAVDRRSRRSYPRGKASKTTPRKRQLDTRNEIADDLDIDPGGVAVRDRRGGMDAFLRSSGASSFGDNVAEDFAGEADFVESGDVDARVDPREFSADPQVARGRREDVADRARRETAEDMDFVRRNDLEAEVGPRGIEDIGIPGGRREDVADRAAEEFAGEDRFAKPEDFEVEVGRRGIEDAGLTSMGERRRASRQFEAETALGDVDPREDLKRRDEGFGLDSRAERRAAARSFEEEYDAFGSGDLDPQDDVRRTDDGFGLGRDPTRELAAEQLDEEVDGFDVGADDIELRETDDGFEAVFKEEMRR